MYKPATGGVRYRTKPATPVARLGRKRATGAVLRFWLFWAHFGTYFGVFLVFKTLVCLQGESFFAFSTLAWHSNIL